MTKFDFLSGTNRLRYLVGIPSVSRVVSLSRPGSVSLDMPTDSQPTHQRCATSAREVLKFAAVFALLVTVGIGNVWGAEVTLTFTTDNGRKEFSPVLPTPSEANSTSALNVSTTYTHTNSGINIKVSKGSSSNTPAIFWKNNTTKTDGNTDLRIYRQASSGSNLSGNTITISSSNTITALTINGSSLGGLTTSTGTSGGTASAKTWSGSATSITFTNTSTSNIPINNIVVTYSSGPSITTSVSSLSGVGYSTNDFSQQVQSFTVSGSSLTADVTVTAPDGFEVSKSSGSGYASSVTFSKGSGTLTAQTVYVRLASGKSAGNYSGDVTCSSTSATSKTVALSGSVPFTVTWKANGTTHATTYVAYATSLGTALGSLPSAPDPEDYVCTGKSFYGWYDGASYSHASTAPAIVSTTTKITSDKTYNAVFATATLTDNYKQISSKDDLVAGAKYLIVGNSSSTYKALPVDKATSLTSVTPSSSVISNPAADLIWTLEGSADKWKIKSTSNSKYIQISGGNLTFETSTSLTFSASVSSSSFAFTSSASSGNKILSYYHDKNMFNAFTKENTVYVYKQQVNYTAYSTACEACAADPTVGSASLKGAFSLSSVGVTVTCCKSFFYVQKETV